MTSQAKTLMVCVLITGCGDATHDRKFGPHVAFEQAKVSLHRKDIKGYVDALNDDAVLQLLGNALFICVGHLDKETTPPVRESPGCEGVLAKFGYPHRGIEAFQRRAPGELRTATGNLDFRELTSDLESYNRRVAGSSSFAWGFLDESHLEDVLVDGGGGRAKAILVGPYDRREISFENDTTGWRMGWER